MKQTISEAAQEYTDKECARDNYNAFIAGVEWMREQYENAVFNYVRDYEYMSNGELDRMLDDINTMIQ